MADENQIIDFFRKIKMGDVFTVEGNAPDVLETLTVDMVIKNMEYGPAEIVTNKASVRITRANATSRWMISTEKNPKPVTIVRVE